jgi:hypothetical protein
LVECCRVKSPCFVIVVWLAARRRFIVLGTLHSVAMLDRNDKPLASPSSNAVYILMFLYHVGVGMTYLLGHQTDSTRC